MSVKKVAILSLHLGYGGIEKSVAALANILCEKYEVEIACTYKLYDVPAFKIDDRVKITYLVENYTPNKKEFKEKLRDKKLVSTFFEGLKSLKILYLRIKELIEKWKRPIQNWKKIQQQLMEIFGERYTKYLEL